MSGSLRPGKPTMLSHAAFVTHDTAATADFFTRVLGMELVNAVLDDKIPSTGEPVPYFHSFFKMRDGSTIAFFEAPELPERPAPPHPAYDTFEHLAMQVDSREEVDAWSQWLTANGIDVVGPVDHQIIYSVYFHEPGGLRLEITTPLLPVWNDNAAAAAESLREWEEMKKAAANDGVPLTQAVTELATRRSHRRTMDDPPVESVES
ncbi:MAG TPA: VOC family protein [Mycobacteriales bacterium]|nr:VOC family protein [Mycobacteriales bacterium]